MFEVPPSVVQFRMSDFGTLQVVSDRKTPVLEPSTEGPAGKEVEADRVPGQSSGKGGSIVISLSKTLHCVVHKHFHRIPQNPASMLLKSVSPCCTHAASRARTMNVAICPDLLDVYRQPG